MLNHSEHKLRTGAGQVAIQKSVQEIVFSRNVVVFVNFRPIKEQDIQLFFL